MDTLQENCEIPTPDIHVAVFFSQAYMYMYIKTSFEQINTGAFWDIYYTCIKMPASTICNSIFVYFADTIKMKIVTQ